MSETAFPTSDAFPTAARDESLREPPMYNVLFHNDDFTPMEFVVAILIQWFDKSPAAAEKIMLTIHNDGMGLCGVYTREIGETKINLVHAEAEKYEFPLRATIEKT